MWSQNSKNKLQFVGAFCFLGLSNLYRTQTSHFKNIKKGTNTAVTQ